ncbi:MAG: ATP-dependent zinc metalloprotease FtsH [Lachnospiraceae bacterium]|nr:ATP-dependent zinc metalloprotease FtsH [Lachnospiraceae bacterium]
MSEYNEYNNYNGNGNNGGDGDGPNGYNRGPGGNGDGGKGGPGKDPRTRQTIYVLIIATLFTILGMSFMSKALTESTTQEIPYSQFLSMLSENKVSEVEITPEQINISPVSGNGAASLLMTYYTGVMNDPFLVERLEEAGVKYTHKIPDRSGAIISAILNFGLPLLLVWGLLTLFMRRMGGSGGGILGVGKSASKAYVTKDTGVSFKDVAGQEEAKESLQEMVDFLHNPQKYARIGARLPKGALLVGPPGTGKTLLAKAVAGEAHVPFYSLAGSDFVEMFVGVGASRVRDLFSDAEKNAPCIIFIDEIDAIGKSRDSRYGGGNDEREQTLNQLLSEMDGFDSSKGILVLGATNRPETLDKALLRPGRFDRRVIVDKPDLKGRIDTLKVHARDVKLDESVDFEAIALATSGAVGSDLANMVNEAAINAVKSGRQFVNQKDLMDSVEVVLVGKEKKDRIMSKEERRIVSYHEIGHALVSALQKNSEPVQKITIVPRTMGALGYVMNVPEEEKYLNTEAELHALLVETLGGRAAEEIVFDTVTTGAQNDIEKATKIARAMVTQYGMSKKFGLMGLETIQDQYLEGRTVMNCSDETAAAVDDEVMKILKEAYKEAKSLLKSNRALLDKLAKFLIEKETITGKEFMDIYRKEKGLTEEETSGKGKERIALKGVKGSKSGKENKDKDNTSGKEKTVSTEHTFEAEINDNTVISDNNGTQDYPVKGYTEHYGQVPHAQTDNADSDKMDNTDNTSSEDTEYESMGAVVRGRKNGQ